MLSGIALEDLSPVPTRECEAAVIKVNAIDSKYICSINSNSISSIRLGAGDENL